MKLVAIGTIGLFLWFSGLEAEIQRVLVKWDPIACQRGCPAIIEKRFSLMPGVAEVNNNDSAGLTELIWKPNYPFNAQDIQTTMLRIGLGINVFDTRVQVRGTITHDRDFVRLVSIGDNTTFVLLGDVKQSTHRYVDEFAVENHKLSDDLRRQLIEAENEEKVVVIQGVIFQIEWPPLKMIVTNLRIPQDNGK